MTLLQAGVVVSLVGVAVLALVRAPRSGPSGWWAAAAFAALASATSLSWLPGWAGWSLPGWMELILPVAVLAFPYLLLRFTASFRPLPGWLEVVAAVGAAVVLLGLLVSGEDPGQPVLLVVLAYWIGLSLVTVVRLWRAGRGQPGVARRRMRLMAVGATLLTVALVLAVQLQGRAAPETVVLTVTLGSAVGFGLGFAPPRALRLSWRGHEDRQARAATLGLLRAATSDEVAACVLGPTMAIVGTRGTVLLAADGTVVASQGDVEPVEVPPASSAGGETDRLVAELDGQGWLVGWTSPYAPFFGPEERGLFESMASVTALALQRVRLAEEDRAHRAALEAARQRAEEAHRRAEQAREQAEQAKQEADAANLAKSEFLSRMSHELRTPLNAVLGFGQLLELADLDGQDREAVGHILKAGRHLLALIDDVLDLSRIEAGTLTVSPEPVAADELINESVALIAPVAEARGIQVSASLVDCTVHVRTDRQRCRQVLLNLLSNAVKYNHDGGRVDVTCSRQDERRLRIAVRDTGPGIDPARQGRLFRPFDRLGAEASTVEGTGLGLALSRQLIEQLDGSMGVESVVGQGTTFWVDLPVTAAPPVPDLPAAPTTDGVPSEHRRKVLLVEDNLANLRLVTAVLRRRPDVGVIPAMQGTLALELAAEHRPDAIVLDLHLPDMPGREVLARLKANPTTRHIPVIVASADASPRRVDQLRDEGAEAFLTKPLDVADFLATLDRALEAGRATHE